MSRRYEVLIILKAAGTDAELAQSVSQIEEPIKKLGGQIECSQSFGRRRLAYRIARQSEGHYQFVQFGMLPDHVNELKRLLRLNETIVRFLILNRTDHEQAAVPVTRELTSGRKSDGQSQSRVPDRESHARS